MAVSFLTAAQRDRYGRYPDVVTPNDLSRCFHLSDDDRAQIMSCRGRPQSPGLCAAAEHRALPRHLSRRPDSCALVSVAIPVAPIGISIPSTACKAIARANSARSM